MFFFIVLGIVLVVTLVLSIGGFASGSPGAGVLALVVGGVVTGLTWLMFSFTHVDHREVAIVTTFGKYDGTISTGGAHWLKPWSSIEKFDRTVQTAEAIDISVSFSDGGGEDGLAEIGGGKGLIDSTVRWQMSGDEEGAKALWERYRTFDAVQSSLVERSARDMVISVANSYPAATAIISQKDIADAVAEELTSELAQYGIVIDSVSIPAIDLDPSTQAAVDKLFTTQQDIKRAQNEQIRAEIDAETVEIREQSGALSPEANQRYCMEVSNSWDVAKNGPLPATWNCSVGGNDTPVIVDGTP